MKKTLFYKKLWCFKENNCNAISYRINQLQERICFKTVDKGTEWQTFEEKIEANMAGGLDFPLQYMLS